MILFRSDMCDVPLSYLVPYHAAYVVPPATADHSLKFVTFNELN